MVPLQSVRSSLFKSIVAIADEWSSVNSMLKQHCNLVYSSPALRHVAEQVDSLYWLTVTGEEGIKSAPPSVLHQELDLTDSRCVCVPFLW